MDEQRTPAPYAQGPGWSPPPHPAPYVHPTPYPPYPVRRSYGQWYYLVPALSFGYLAWVPFLHAGGRLRRPDVWGRAGAIGVATVGGYGLVSIDDAQPLGALYMIALAIVACFVLRPLRREVYDVPPVPSPVPLPHDPSVAHVLHGRALRAKAREIVATDPLMARELRIGRPDLPGRHFQDGGLVDVNCATAEMLSIGCGLSMETAQEIVTARGHLGSFGSIDEVVAYASLTPGAAESVREYGVVIPA